MLQNGFLYGAFWQMEDSEGCCAKIADWHRQVFQRSCVYLLFAVRDVADTTPGKRLVGIEFAVGAVDVKALSIHAK